MGGPLPPALMCTALGLMLSFVPLRVHLTAWVIAGIAALPVIFVAVPSTWAPVLFSVCWISIIITAGMVHLPGGPPPIAAFLAAANAGLWTGLTAKAGATYVELSLALLLVGLAMPGRALVGHKMGIGVKVVASWLLAISILGAALPFAPTLLGYQADHLE